MVFWYDFRPCTRNVADGGIGIGMADDFQQRSCHHQVAQAARFDDDDWARVSPGTTTKRASNQVQQGEGVAQEVTEYCNSVLSQITPLRSGQHLQTYADAVMMVERDRLARALSLHLQRSCILRFPRA